MWEAIGFKDFLKVINSFSTFRYSLLVNKTLDDAQLSSRVVIGLTIVLSCWHCLLVLTSGEGEFATFFCLHCELDGLSDVLVELHKLS